MAAGNYRKYLSSTGLVLTLVLAGCGGSDGGVASASSPGTIAPPASYTKLVDMSGNRTFQTAGVHYASSAAGISNPSTDQFGSGVTVVYTAASDSYQLTAPGGATATFTPADFQPAASAPTVPNVAAYQKTSGSTSDILRLIVPTLNGVPLSYVTIGSWGHSVSGATTLYLALGGAPTIASDMPKAGTASYAVTVGGTAVVPNGAGGATANPLNGAATGTFSANFATGAITNSVHLLSTTGTDFGTFNGTGTIASASPGFSGTFAGTTTSTFSGAFFGPQATEMGMAYFIGTPTFSVGGVVTGLKN